MTPLPGTLGNIVPRAGDPGAIMRILQDLQRQITEDRGARTLAASSITGGGITVAGGLITVLDGSGNVLCTIGTNTDGSIGLRTFRPAGTPMFSSMGQGTGGLNYTQVNDKFGFTAFNDDPLLGGLQRPYLPMGPLVDASTPGTVQAPTTSATYVTMQTGYCVRSHPRVRWDAIVSSSSAGTTGNVQLIDASSNVIGVVAVPANAVSFVTLGPVQWPAGTWAPGDGQYLSVQAQRTAGTGTIGVRTTGLSGQGFL